MIKNPQDPDAYSATMVREHHEQNPSGAASKIAAIQGEKDRIEADIRASTAKLKALDEELREGQRQLEREKNRRDVFPAGFTFRYNNRRGDPQYTCFWECTLLDAHGKEVWRGAYSEDKYNEHSARTKALDTAWELVDIAEAIRFHIRLKS